MNAKKSTFHHTNGIVHFLKTNGGIMAVLVIFIVILSVSTPIFPTIDNIMSVLRQVFTNVCLGLGLTLVIILGEIDLTGGAVMAMTGTYTVSFIVNGNMPVVVAIILGLCLGLLVGFLNGAIISALNVPAFIVTLSFMNIARGAGYLATGGLATRIQDPAFTDLGVGRIFDIPIQIYYSIVLIIIFAIILNKTKFGTYIFAIGGNREAARLSGIPIRKVQIIVFSISGLMSAIAGIVLAARMYSAQPNVAEGSEMDAIAACVLGGVSMRGGIGSISGAIIGVLVIGLINNGLNLLGVNSFWQLIAKGVVILVAIYIDTMKNKYRFKGTKTANAQ